MGKALVLVQVQIAQPVLLASQAAAFCAERGGELQRLAWSRKLQLAYAYAQLDPAAATDMDALAGEFTLACHATGNAQASPLEPVFETPGASAGRRPIVHYVVEMDPEPGWMPEIARWYDTEHMPGLAAVPGCVRARRFFNHGHGPLSLACYDLVAEGVPSSPAWLAVRGTAWSDVTRPHFTNTRRNFFDVLA